MLNFTRSLIATAAILASSAASAALVPVGVQNDVALGTVAGWGFSECSVVNYAQSNAGSRSAAMLSGCSGDYLMMAARRVGSTVYEVLAAADFSDVIFETGTGNTTHSANGVEWYFNDNYSWGFAGGGDVVSRTSCDTAGYSERDRLCWHTHDYFSGGWRAGSFTNLNNDSGWEKVLLVANDGHQVPEPVGLAFLALGLTGALTRRCNG